VARLRSWLAAPRYPDEEKTRIARIVHVVAVAMILALLPALAHNHAAGRHQAVVPLAAELALTLLCLVLNYRGAVRAAARLFPVSAVGMAAALLLVGERGVHDVAVLIYPAAILVGGALFGRRGFAIFTLLVMAALAFQYTVELSGLVVYQLTPFVELRLLIDSEIILGVSALGVGLLMGNLRRSMAQARAAVASLRESEALYRSLFESVNEAILVHDTHDGRICDANARAVAWSGYSVEELRRLSVADLSADRDGFTQAEALRHMGLAAQGQPQLFEWLSRDRAQRLFWTEISMVSAVVGGAPRVLVSVRDIDERKRAEVERQRLEGQLRQAQKLESVGRLAGGIAHDFNNLLTCILGNVDLSATVLPAGHPAREYLDEIMQAARRAAELTSKLLAFSRKQPIAPVPLRVESALLSLDRMLRRMLGETVSLTTRVAPGLDGIRADPVQLEQILLNLAVNARDAMPGGGRLELVAESRELDQAFAAEHPGARAGQFVCISVSDTGTGMSQEVQRQAFEPFFTTKPPGQGTGLGLAMVLGAMEQNGGFVVLSSRPGQGSRFELFFPRHGGDVEPIQLPPQHLALPTGKERILLVEDDASVRHLSERLLTQLGYRVTASETGAAALALYQQADLAFDLLVTDLVLPDLDGRTLARRLLALQPGLRVLYCSGYSEDVIAHGGVLEEGLAFLPKPFSVEVLAAKVRTLLDEAPGTPPSAGA